MWERQKNVSYIVKIDEYVHDYEWTSEMEERAKKLIEEDTGSVVSNPKTSKDNHHILLEEVLEVQSKNWEKFYKFNKTNFFKDRHYILREFEELKNDFRVNS